ncbi:hypothetical protein BGZ73_001653, partial [Actinomortierella ambigua]
MAPLLLLLLLPLLLPLLFLFLLRFPTYINTPDAVHASSLQDCQQPAGPKVGDS